MIDFGKWAERVRSNSPWVCFILLGRLGAKVVVHMFGYTGLDEWTEPNLNPLGVFIGSLLVLFFIKPGHFDRELFGLGNGNVP